MAKNPQIIEECGERNEEQSLSRYTKHDESYLYYILRPSSTEQWKYSA